MSFVAIVVAGAAAWIFGAVWYSVVGQQWMAAAGLTEDSIDRKNPVPYIGSFLCALVVAAMSQHILLSSGVSTFFGGLISGLGLGLFIATPWLTTNYLFAQRDLKLILIDGIYATVGCAIIGAVLMLF